MTGRSAISITGCVVLLVSGQLLLKQGLTRLGGFTLSWTGFGREVAKLAGSPWIWAGLAVTGLSSLLWFDVISRVQLSFAYPLLSTSYVLMMLASWLFLSEPPTLTRWLGVLVICVGVFLVSRS